MVSRYWLSGVVTGLILALTAPLSQADSSFASSAEDRKAKQAVPPNGKVLLYIYRQSDKGPQRSPTLYVNAKATGRLVPNSYYLLTVSPGRVDVRADSSGSKTLSLQAKGGRVLFVHMTVDREGDSNLRQVSYGAGRQGIQHARLMTEAKEPVAAKAPVDEKEGGFTLILKGGSAQMASASQTLFGLQRNFEGSATGFGIEAEWRFRNGWAFGGEAYQHVHAYTTTGSPENGELTLLHLMVNGKKYFRTDQQLQPYIGLGLGGVTASFTAGTGGGINGSAGGFAGQVMGGAAFRWERVGVYTELKYQSAKATDANSREVDASGMALFAGMSVHF